ncbi:MAG: hypothetical protein ACREOK_11565 [Gemmatimonadaceae bacterium]
MRRLLVILLLSCGAAILRAQDSAAATSLNVYLDCQTFGCDFDFFRTELTLVNWVRDRQVADLHLLVTSQTTGAGGSEYTVNFIGLRQFAGMTDTLKYVAPPAVSDDERRRGLARVFRLGLVRYLARTPAASRITVSVEGQQGAAQTIPADDRWKNWVFRISMNSNFNGEEQFKSVNLGGSVSATRITAEWKTEISARESYGQSEFELDDSTTFVNINRFYGATLLQVKSLGEHWSAGFRGSMTSSTYDNYLRAIRLAPAIEYNIFPYSQSTRRQIRFEYDLGYSMFAYRDTTIFFKTKESMPYHRLTTGVATRETWGSIDVGSAATQYLHDLSTYRISNFGELSLRLFKGFSLNGFGSYDIIYDQFGLALKDFTPEQKLTRQFQLGTRYQFFGFVSLSYTFGSIFNNIVNPRMNSFFD